MKKTLFVIGCLLGAVIEVCAQFHMADIRVETPLDAHYENGILKLYVRVADDQDKSSSGTLSYKLLDSDGREVAASVLNVSMQQPEVSFQPCIIDQPGLWSAEAPVLYTLVLKLQKKNEKQKEEIIKQIGFRSVEVSEKKIVYNGRELRVKGINYQPAAGGGSSKQRVNQLRKDLVYLKKNHVNALRLRHSNMPEELVGLCDEYGFYLLYEDVSTVPHSHPSVIPCPSVHPAIQEHCLWDYPNKDLDVKMEEMQKLYQDIRFYDFDRETGSINIQNLHHSTSLSLFDFYYLVRDHGKEVLRAPLLVGDVAPGQSVRCNGLQGITSERTLTGDVRIEFYATLRQASPFFEKGSIIAREQTYIHTFYRPEVPAEKEHPLITHLVESDDCITLQGKHLQIVFQRSSGQLVSYRYLGEEYLYSSQGPRPFFWRVPTFSDVSAGLPQSLQAWREASYQPLQAKSFTCVRAADAVAVLTATYDFPAPDAQWRIVYKVYANGVIKVDNHFEAASGVTSMIPRVGLRVQLNPAFNQVCYFGRGPRTNYRDCRTAQFLGTYVDKIHTMLDASSYPQENGHRTDIYWCALQGHLKGGLLLVADRTFEMNLFAFPQENLERSTPVEHGKLVDFFIDYRMMGVGADNRFRTPVQEPYLIRPGKENAIDYGFAIVPFQKHTDYLQLIRKYK
ncbi:glycoside hydrolase family 2 [gut metagenome]|uniref:beta-galactosidase n=1 Tax=gut metagenome TaxID=749906 RepID=J9GF06_9ZZZZ